MTDREAMKMALEALGYGMAVVERQLTTKTKQEYSIDLMDKAFVALRQALAHTEIPMSPEHLPRYVATNGVKPMEGGGGGGSQPEQVSGDTSDGYHTFNELYDFRKAYNAALFNEWAASGKYSVHKSKRHYDGKECFGGGWFIVVAQLPNGQISNHYEMKDWDKFQLPEADKALFEYDNHTGADVLHRLFSLQPFAQPDNTSDSATRSADSAESFCKQELHNLMSVAGRMALELECLLLDTKDLSVVSQWWDTGMESLQAYRDYIWSITHGKDGEHFCDTNCVHTDHHPDCELAQPEQDSECNPTDLCAGCRCAYSRSAQPEQEPVAWVKDGVLWNSDLPEKFTGCLYTAPPSKQWVGLTDEERRRYNDRLSGSGVAEDIEAKLKEKNA